MPKYTVIGLVSASVSAKVEANTPQDAIEAAELCASICHQCADDLDVGDVYETLVVDTAGEEVYRNSRDSRADIGVLTKYLQGKKNLPKNIIEIVKAYT
jgi:hypothetical protein